MQRPHLPPSDIVRWSPQRKAAVVEAVRDGAISFSEACQRYQLSPEELSEWQQAMAAHGIGGVYASGPRYYREMQQLRLTGRQQRAAEVRHLIVEGMGIEEIARRLGVGERTVYRILAGTKARDRPNSAIRSLLSNFQRT